MQRILPRMIASTAMAGLLLVPAAHAARPVERTPAASRPYQDDSLRAFEDARRHREFNHRRSQQGKQGCVLVGDVAQCFSPTR